jgi:hypothetical protein
MASARLRRKTRVEVMTAMVAISTGMEVPMTDRMTSAKIRVGIAITVSTTRDMSMSGHPPAMAAVNPLRMPMANARAVVTRERAIVVRAP